MRRTSILGLVSFTAIFLAPLASAFVHLHQLRCLLREFSSFDIGVGRGLFRLDVGLFHNS